MQWLASSSGRRKIFIDIGCVTLMTVLTGFLAWMHVYMAVQCYHIRTSLRHETVPIWVTDILMTGIILMMIFVVIIYCIFLVVRSLLYCFFCN